MVTVVEKRVRAGEFEQYLVCLRAVVQRVDDVAGQGRHPGFEEPAVIGVGVVAAVAEIRHQTRPIQLWNRPAGS